MNKKIIAVFVVINTLMFPYQAFGTSVPVPIGFEEDFVLKEREVKVRNLDGSYSAPILFLAKYDKIKLDKNNSKSIELFTKYLKENQILEKYQNEMLSDLMEGREDKGLCAGNVTDCSVVPDLYDFYYDFNDNQLLVFVNPKILSYETKLVSDNYYSSVSYNNGLINSFDLFFGSYYKQNSTISLNDKMILGLPYGYLKGDFNLNNSTLSDNAVAYEASYNLDIDAYALKMGYFKYAPSVNTTDFLNGMTNLSQSAAIFASSKKLQLGGAGSDRVLEFYAAQSGSVMVYRNERVIYQANISEGKNSISYADLPYGRYEIRVDVKNSGNTIHSQVFQIYNTAKDALALDEIDYLISAGLLHEPTDVSVDESMTLAKGDIGFAKAFVSYQWVDSTLLGLGAVLSQEGESVSLGAQHNSILLGLRAEGLYEIYQGAHYFNATASLLGLNVSYEDFSGEENTLATYSHGYRDFTKHSIGYSHRLGGNRLLYANASRTNYERKDDLDADNVTNYYSIGYTSPFIARSRFDFNVDYTKESDDLRFNLSWTVPLSDTVEAITSITTNRSELRQFSTSLRKNDIVKTKNFQGNLEAVNIYRAADGSMEQEARFSGYGSSQYANMNVSAYASTENERGLNGTISSTQVITTKGIDITNKSAEAYAIVDIDNFDEQYDQEKGVLSIKQNNNSPSKSMIYDDTAIAPLNSYAMYQVKFDTESVDMYNSGESDIAVFSHPGTVATFSPQVRRVVSFISSFYDLFENPIQNLTCEGEGCYNITEIMAGVYKVTVLEGMDFKLESSSAHCLLPNELSSNIENTNFGKNYCLPVARNNERFETIELGNDRRKIYYLGTFEQSGIPTEKINLFELLGYEIIEKSIGSLKAIYLSQIDSKMDGLIVKYRKQIEEIISLSLNDYSLEHISLPLVSTE